GGVRRRSRGRGLKVTHVATGGQRECRAQQRRRSPRAATRPLPSRTLCHRCHSYVSRALVPAQQFDLPHPERLYPRPAMRLDPATDTNSTTFKRLQHDPGGFECRQPMLWNSHSKVPCPVPSEIQVSRCPCLPNGQNLALDHSKPPNP